MDKRNLVPAKVGESIKFVSDLLEESLNLVNEKKFNEIRKVIWKIASELEYIASMVSIVFGFGDFYPRKDIPNELELEELLNLIKDSLTDLNDLIDGNPKEAYERLRASIRYTRMAQSKSEE